MNILWFLDKEFDSVLNVSARLATIKYLEQHNNITVVTFFRKYKKKFPEIKSQIVYLNVIKIPILKKISSYYKQLKYVKTIDLNKLNLIFINSKNIFLLNKLKKLKAKYDVKIVMDIRTLPVDINIIKKSINEYMFKKCLMIASKEFDGVTYITEEMKDFCEKKYNLQEHRNIVWQSGVDISLFKPHNFSYGEKKFRIMYHGAISNKRGIRSAIIAIKMLKDYDIEFNIVGDGTDLKKNENFVRRLGLADKVNFLGRIPFKQIPIYLNKMDAGILPFPDYEGWNTSSPIKLFEYLASGRPVIVTKIPAHVKVLENKEFAFWADSSDPESISKAILEAYKNKGSFERLGAAARDFAKMNYSWEIQLSKLNIFLKSIL